MAGRFRLIWVRMYAQKPVRPSVVARGFIYWLE